MTQLIYTYDITGEEGDYVVSFPDVSPALTGGETLQECHELARDCLIGALASYIHANESIPVPKAKAEGGAVYLRPVEAAKVALWNGMMERGMSRVALANLLDTHDKTVRRWLDFDHSSKIEDINNVLRTIFNLRLVTTVMKRVA